MNQDKLCGGQQFDLGRQMESIDCGSTSLGQRAREQPIYVFSNNILWCVPLGGICNYDILNCGIIIFCLRNR